MNGSADGNPYTADFDFFDRLYGYQGEIFEAIETPDISEPFHKAIEIIEELEREYPKEKERLKELGDLVSDTKHSAVIDSFSAGVRETRKLLCSFSSLKGGPE